MPLVALSERGSMIRPVEHKQLPAYPPDLQLGAITLRRKEEHHITVFNYALGKLIAKAAAQRPSLRDELLVMAAAHDWRFMLGGVHYHLVQFAREPVLHTVVVMVACDLAGYFARVRAHASELGCDLALLDALARPGPPHITLYTSDPTGKAGIGLNTVTELDAAQTAAEQATPGVLHAYRLAPGVVDTP